MLSKINITTTVKDFISVQNTSFTNKALLTGLANFLRIDSLQIAIPPRWYNMSPSDILAAKVIRFLRKEGLCGQMSLDENLFPDEPFLYIASLYPRGRGADFFSKERAIWRAIGENLERRLWEVAGNYLREKSFKKTKDIESSENFLNPNALAGFSDEQKQQIRKKYPKEDKDLYWFRASTLTPYSPVNIPYQLIDPFHQRRSGEPLLRWDVSTGLAVATTIEEAIVKGMLEVIERDAIMINYLNKIPSPTLDNDKICVLDSEISYILGEFERFNITPCVSLLATDSPVHVVQVTLIDRHTPGPTIAVGARASFSLKTAIIDALTEALSVRIYQRSLGKMMPNDPLDKKGRLVYWAQKNDISSINYLLRGPQKELTPSMMDSPFIEIDEQLRIIKKYLSQKKYDGYYVNITPKKIQRGSGLVCVMSIIPQLQPLHLNESIPCLGGERLSTIPELLGYTPSANPNPEPHFFS